MCVGGVVVVVAVVVVVVDLNAESVGQGYQNKLRRSVRNSAWFKPQIGCHRGQCVTVST